MRWWTRFVMGWSVAGQMVNLVMLSAALSPSLSRWIGGEPIWYAVCLPPAILAGLTGLGWALDRMEWYQRVDYQNRMRSRVWDDLIERLDRIERRLP